MRLQANAVDRRAGVFEGDDEIVERLEFRAVAFAIVFVDVELCMGVGGARGAKRDRYIVWSKRVVEDAATPAAVVGERLIDHVPGVDDALIASDFDADIILNQRFERGRREAS